MAGYTRQSAAEIVDDAIIEASHFNNEYDAVEAAFDATAGHKHDGSLGEGARITVLGPVGAVLTAAAGSLTPQTTNIIDLGSTSLRFKAGWFQGNVTAAGGFTGDLTGNAATATKLATARDISLTGAVTGTGSFDGSGNVSITTSGGSVAPIASPTFTGTPAAPTAAVDTNTTQIATTAFVLGQAGSASPLINGTAAAGTSLRYSRQDHVHPTDTTLLALTGGTLTGNLAVSKANPAITLNKAASGQTNSIFGQKGGTNRWEVRLGNTESEAGSNAGSNLTIWPYTAAVPLISGLALPA